MTDIKELAARLRDLHARTRFIAIGEAADALEAQASEIARLTTNGIHTCHDQCQRLACAQGREIAHLKEC